ncbi:MAG: DUF192 domain-containing protein [Candidatus Dormibacteria bacterium]
MTYRLETSDGRVVASHVSAATGIWSRFCGLMLRPSLPEGQGLVLRPCTSIHMFFMRFAIDAVFVDSEGVVVGLRPHLRPWIGFAACRKAKACIELPAGTLAASQLRVGERVDLIAA